VLPASLSVDGARLLYGSRRNPGREADVAFSLLLDRGIGLAALLALAMAFGAMFLGGGAAAALAGALVLAGTGVVWMARLPSVRRRFPSIANAMARPGLLVRPFGLSCLGHFSAMAGTWFAFHALGLPAPPLVVLAIDPIVIFARNLPVTPMGLGLSEMTAAMLYPIAGTAGGAEAAVVTRFAMVLLYLCCGSVFLFPLRRQRSSEPNKVALCD
jgi:uncharacterized membrane protein YbhN (UPF0104 family)